MAQTIIVDISTRGANPVAYTHQGDTGRTFFAEIYENGEAFAVAGYTIKVGAILPADRGYTVIAGNDMVTATKTNDNTTNKIYFTLSDKYSLKAGNGILTLIFTSNTGTPSTIRPINIDLRIQKSADADDTIAGASDFPEGLEAIAEEVFQEYLSTYLPPVAPSASAAANKAADAKLTGEALDDLKSDISEFENGISTSELITIPRTEQNGYIIKSNGEVVSGGANNQVTDPIDISAYQWLYITARANYSTLLYAFYDANSVFISGEASNGGESSTLIEDKKVAVPSGAKFLRMSNRYNFTPYPNAKYIEYTLKGTEDIPSIKDTIDDITATETYPIEFIENPTWEAGYVSKTGAVTAGGTSYVHTDNISVKVGDVIKTYNTISCNASEMRFVTAYDTTGSAVFASGAEHVVSYTVPSGIVSIIISVAYSSSASTLYAIHHNTSETDNVISVVSETDVLFNKKWCVCGDSFSYGGQSPMPVFSDGRYKGSRKAYPYFIGNRTHIDIVDFTANGRTLAYPSDGSFSNSLTNPSAEQYYQNIPTDVDYITIYLGINDSHHASGSSGSDGEDVTGVIPIGTVDDTTTETFGGAWNVVLSWLITNRPNAHIGIIVSNGVDNVSYRDMTIAIAKKYGIAYIDLNGDDRTPAMIRTVNPDIAQSVKTALINKWAVEVGVNTHPNTDAHEYESYFIENFLRSI